MAPSLPSCGENERLFGRKPSQSRPDQHRIHRFRVRDLGASKGAFRDPGDRQHNFWRRDSRMLVSEGSMRWSLVRVPGSHLARILECRIGYVREHHTFTEQTMRSRGFTILELLVVITIIGVTTAMAFPKLHDAMTHEATRSARREFTTQMARARATAIQRGCRATLQIRASTQQLYIETCRLTGAGLDTLKPQSYLGSNYGVTMTSTADSLPFAPTSLGLGTGTISLTFVKSGYTSALRVTAIGRAVW